MLLSVKCAYFLAYLKHLALFSLLRGGLEIANHERNESFADLSLLYL